MSSTESTSHPAVLVATGLGLFMIFLDATIVNVALPDIQSEFHVGEDGIQWVVAAYSLTMAMFMMTAATFADAGGRRRAYVIGLAIFGVASIGCAIAPGIAALNIFRGMQGVGAAVVNVASLALVSAAFEDPKARAGAIGMWTGIAGVGLAIGPTLGGVLTETFGWRSVFIINPIVSVIAIALTYRYVSESRNPAHRKLDIWGQLLFIVAVGAITYALVEGPQKGWASPLILTCLIGSLVLAAVFVRVELHSHYPMMEVGVFRDPVYSTAIVTLFAVMFTIYGSMLLVTQYFQTVREYSPEKAGFLMLAMTLPTIVLAPIAGRIAAQRGGRGPTLAGVAAIIAGTAALAVSAGGGTGLTLVALFLLGTGAGLSVAPATNLAMTPIAPQRAGMASGILSAQRALGSTAGFAIMGSVLAGVVALVLPGKLEPYISNPAERSAVASDVADTANPQAVTAFIGPGKPLPDTVQESEGLVDAADEAFVAGIRVALAVGFVVVTAAFVAGWIIFPRRRSREHPDEPPQGVVELTD